MISVTLRDQLRRDSAHSKTHLLQPEEWCRAPTISSSSSSALPSLLSGADLAIALTLPEASPGCCYAGLLIVYVG
jgi:hypothetical protein